MGAASSTGPSVNYRPATEADLEAEARIFIRAEGEFLARHNFPWGNPPVAAVAAELGHLLAHDPGRCWVAVAEGEIVGFTAALVRDDLWYFATLFIDPSSQGRGVGGRLFALAHEGAPRRQATLTDSIQPVSNTIYARHGLVPTTPMLEFDPPPGHVARPAPATSLRPVDGLAADLVALDLAAYGADRAADHEFWSQKRARTTWAVRDRIVAYSYVGPSGRIGPLAAVDEARAAEVLGLELARRPDAWVEVPGTAREMTAVALAAGLRIAAPVGLVLLSEAFQPPRALAISDWFLF